ncbi:MAG: hypothetical protein LBU61_00770 [Coriobacteriales bacterium]|jgi:uroporphyrinogen-III decarboxylase|nr:hypothetical protein [Coriobacteriales bacterium]
MLSTKDNLLLLLNKQVPEYIPNYDIFWGIMGAPPFFMKEQFEDGSGIDWFGVEWVVENNPTKAAMPKTHDFILKDITKWRDVIKVPDFSDYDWEASAKSFRDNWDPNLPVAGGVSPSVGYFESLMAFMGFDEGLVACCEEPDEVKALMEYLSDWAIPLCKKYVHFYKPDYGWFGDDIAHERNPFVSLPQFKELFAPYWRRFCEVFLEAGIPVVHHNCGHFELFLDELVDMGVTAWEPVQTSNDMYAIKEKFGNNLALIQSYDVRLIPEEASEEEVRAIFREHLVKMATGGGFGMFASDPEMNGAATELEKQRIRWVISEFEALRYDFYK